MKKSFTQIPCTTTTSPLSTTPVSTTSTSSLSTTTTTSSNDDDDDIVVGKLLNKAEEEKQNLKISFGVVAVILTLCLIITGIVLGSFVLKWKKLRTRGAGGYVSMSFKRSPQGRTDSTVKIINEDFSQFEDYQ